MIMTKRNLFILIALLLLLPLVAIKPITDIVVGQEAFRSWLLDQVKTETGGTLEYEKISGTPWSLTLTKVVFTNGENGIVRKIEAVEMVTSPRWIPLLQNKLVLKNASFTKGKAMIGLREGKPEQVRLPLGLEKAALKNMETVVEKFAGWTLQLKGSHIGAEVLGGKERVALDVDLLADSATLGRLTLKGIKGDARIDPKGLTVSHAYGQVAEGTLTGKGTVSLSQNGPFTLEDFSLKDFKAGEMLRMLGFSETAEADATLNIPALEGQLHPGKKSLTGKGTLTVAKGSLLPALPPMPMKPKIYDDLSPIRPVEGSIPFGITGNTIALEPSTLSSPIGELKVAGSVSLDGALSIKGTCLTTKDAVSKIPAAGRDAFEKHEGGGIIADFELVGASHQPEVKLGPVVQKAFMGVLSKPVKMLMDNPITNLFGGGDKKEKE